MAAALHVEKPDQPQLAKHDSSILGKILLKKKLFYINFRQIRFGFCYGLYGFNGKLY
jgi:hypothetical protein